MEKKNASTISHVETSNNTVVAYIKVKTTNFAELSKSADNVEKARNRVKSEGNNAWAGVVARALDDGWFESVDPTGEIKDIQSALQGHNHDTLQKDIVDAGLLPSNGRGISRKTGKMVSIINDKGEVKWSEWRATRMITTYPGVLAKVAKAGLISELRNSEGHVIGKTAIEKMANEILGKSKTPLEQFKAALDTAEKKYGKMSVSDAQKANEMLRSFLELLDEADKKRA